MKPLALAMILVLCAAFALAACGESKEDEAKSQVCDARADISKQIDTIRSLPVSTSSIEEAKSSLQAIENDLKDIEDAQSDLSDDRKQQVQSATQAFGAQLQQIVKETLDGLSLSNAKTKLQAGLSSLEAAYKQALEPIDC